MVIHEMVEKCRLLHAVGPFSAKRLVEIDWKGWQETDGPKIRCLFSVGDDDTVQCLVYGAIKRTEGVCVRTSHTWGMLG